MSNVIHKFPSFYDADMNEELYLLPTVEVTKAQYDMIKQYLGVTGPGRQVIVRADGKYYLKSDEASEDAIARITKELADKGQTYPATPTVTPTEPSQDEEQEQSQEGSN